MELILIEVTMLLLAAAAILEVRRRQAAFRMVNPETFARLEQAVRNDEEVKQTWSTALGDLQKNLVSLEQRTAGAERKLAGHGVAPGKHKEFYHAAALLLYAGHPAERVADVLDLSLAQVEMVRELQRMIAAESLGEAAPDNDAGGKSSKRKKPGPRPAKSHISPMRMTDIVAAENPGLDAAEQQPAMNGTAA
ncbi:MAG: hypothetical protein ACREQO_08230 [Candidatus Binatia bacterium]